MARIYANVSQHALPSFSDYTTFSIPWGVQENYEVVRRLGRDKYSDVFEGRNVRNCEKCLIKTLRPVEEKRVKREVGVLQSLKGGVNVVELVDVVRDGESNTPSLIFQYIHNTDFRSLYPRFGDYDIRYYVFELLKALDFCHSKGIMHRDVRPHNVLIDHANRKLRLANFSLAEFYHPGTEYTVRVASYSKAPELLLHFGRYDYSVDMWSVGAMFASMIFRKEPFFHGVSNPDQLIKITKVLGTEELFRYLEKYGIELDAQFDGMLEGFPKRSWESCVTEENRRLVGDGAVDLLEGLLRFDYQERFTAKEAMDHRYFAQIRADEEAAIASSAQSP